jgi:hypothetical protein
LVPPLILGFTTTEIVLNAAARIMSTFVMLSFPVIILSLSMDRKDKTLTYCVVYAAL